MSIQRFTSLLFKATRIQQQIEDELRRPRQRTFRLLKLQKLRLRIKESIMRMAMQDMRLAPIPARINRR